MSKYKVFLITILYFSLVSCEDIFPNKSVVSFKVKNDSQSEIEWVKIYLQDTVDDSFSIKKTIKNVLSINDISNNSETQISKVNLKDFSETGNGFYVIKYKLVNALDTLTANGKINYIDFKCKNEISFAGKYYSNCIVKIEDSGNKTIMASYFLSY